jgi:hypothetical protein
MHNIESIENFEGLKQLFKNGNGFVFIQMLLLINKFHEGPSIAILVDEVVIVLGF